MSATTLNDQATLQHNAIVSQRLHAINNTNMIIMEEIRFTHECINEMLRDYNEIMKFRLLIDDVAVAVRKDVQRMKRDIQVISSCNYYYLQINPIISNDDLLRYDEFLTMSYKVLVRDITSFNTTVDENIEELNKLRDELKKKNERRQLK